MTGVRDRAHPSSSGCDWPTSDDNMWLFGLQQGQWVLRVPKIWFRTVDAPPGKSLNGLIAYDRLIEVDLACRNLALSEVGKGQGVLE
jgi:hypothetical protein